MKRPLLVLLAGLLAGIGAFSVAYTLQTRSQRTATREGAGDLAWLKHEFHLSEDQFRRVAALHHSYQPTCGVLCRRIAEQNRRLRDAVARTNALSEEIKALILETGQARDECRQAMLGHLFAVAREMPPEEGARYLQIMLGATCVLQEARTIDTIQPGTPAAASTHPHHEP